MKKILVFNGYYIPAKNYGGPTLSLQRIIETCSDEYEFYVIASNHDLNDTNIFPNIRADWNDVGLAKVLYIDYKKLNINLIYIKNIINQIKPDIVMGCGIVVPFFKWPLSYICRKKNIPLLLSPRGEICEKAFHMKYLKKIIISYIARFIKVYKDIYFHVTSNEEIIGLTKYYNIEKNKIYFAPNIPRIMKAEERIISKKRGELKVVFISRIQPKKNLLTAIKAIKSVEGNIIFDIYGPIESKDYWTLCLEEINKSNKNNINYCGILDSENVLKTIKNYHCFLFPTLSENYGHAIVEALGASCPIIISRNTTPGDDCEEAGAGYICETYNINEYINALNKIKMMDQIEYDCILRKTSEYFNKRMKKDNSIKLHKRMFENILDNNTK